MRAHNLKIGQKIKQLRKARGISQMKLAETIGVSYQQLQKYERGVNKLSVDRLVQIADAIGFPANRLLQDGNTMVSEEPAHYADLTEDEKTLLKHFSKINDRQLKQAVLDFLKTMTKNCHPSSP